MEQMDTKVSEGAETRKQTGENQNGDSLKKPEESENKEKKNGESLKKSESAKQ